MQGIVTLYGSDLNKTRKKLTDIRSLIEKCGLHPLIKQDLFSDIDRVFFLLGKGKTHEDKVDSKRE